MGVSKEQAERNRDAILAASERLFRERGVDGVGVIALMKKAGFTQGGFYNHFTSKEALATEVIRLASDEAKAQLDRFAAEPPGPRETPLGKRVDYYLSGAHCEDISGGCAFVGLAADVRRLGPKAQAHFAEALSDTFDILAGLFQQQFSELDTAEARERSMAFYSQLVGAVVLARSIGRARPDLAAEILSNTRKQMLGGTEPLAAPARRAKTRRAAARR